MNYDVFISYSTRNKNWADALVHNLENKGIRCWIAPRDLSPGSSWGAGIVEAFQSNPGMSMVLLFSSASMESHQVIKELRLADSYKLLVIPVRIEDVKPSGGDFELELGWRHWLDAFGEQQQEIEGVAERIKQSVLRQKESRKELKTVTKEEARESTVSGVDANEQKYLNALRVAYADGEISPAEKDKLNCLLMDFGILPARAKELEEQVLKELGIPARSEQPIEAKPAVTEPVKEQTLEWPEVGQQFLKELKKAVDLSKLPFQPVEVSTEEEIDEDVELDWWINDDYYFSVWFFSKKLEKVNLAWGIYSRKQRDPLFREFCDELYEIQDLLNEDDDISINDYIYALNTEGCLGFDTSERIAFSELSNPDYVKCVTDQIIAVSQKLWPLIEKKLT